jgi:glutathione S-transferase
MIFTAVADLKLYITYRSPYARKVRIALSEKGLPCEEISVDLANRPPEFFDLNPAGTVPTLVTRDGLVLCDSTLILQYLEETYPQPALLPAVARERWQAWNWEEAADRLCDQQVAGFFERQQKAARAEVFDKAARVSDQILTALEKQLAGRDFVLDRFSVADIALGSTMGWMQFRLGMDWHAERPALTPWLARLDERTGFQRTQPRLG